MPALGEIPGLLDLFVGGFYEVAQDEPFLEDCAQHQVVGVGPVGAQGAQPSVHRIEEFTELLLEFRGGGELAELTAEFAEEHHLDIIIQGEF